MPKFTEEMEGKIITLIEQGYKNAEISRELDIYRGAVAKRRKAYEKRRQNQEKPEPEQDENIQQEQTFDPQKYARAHTRGVALSDSAMSRLNQLYRLLGSNSMEEMIEAVYADYMVAEKYWLKHMEEIPGAAVSKTFAWIIAEEEGYAADLKHDLGIYMEGYREDRKLKEELKAQAERQFDEGYQKGKNDYALLVPCVRCGEPCTIEPGTESHWLIVEVLREHKIAHTDCLPNYERIFA